MKRNNELDRLRELRRAYIRERRANKFRSFLFTLLDTVGAFLIGLGLYYLYTIIF